MTTPPDVETLRRLSALLEEVLDLDAPQREAWLERLDGESPEIAPKLRRVLASDDDGRISALLDRKHDHALPGRASEEDRWAFEPGASVGPYALLRKIARGGMGEVWLAERTSGNVKRSVALKLPTVGLRRSVLVQRFERECDILGSLTHPNIARLYDAGFAEDGQPYLALEYVDGRPITEYADAHGLDARDRVALLRQVMDAVQHAHANLVIHRDLKPSNVLVTPTGAAMLLDFGIAKLLEEPAGHAHETELTRVSGRALTLSYAAPEQVRGGPISIVTDEWALGVLLYELLTGVRPFGFGRSSVDTEILEADPVRPSQRRSGPIAALRRSLASELDTIVLKSLKKDPAERYPTVGALADDLDRWLRGEPVRAQRDSAWYRTRKFVGRHAVTVAAAALAAIAIVGIASIAIVQGLQAREESARAVAAREFMTDLFVYSDPDRSPGKEVTAKQLLVHGYGTVVETLADQPLLQTEILLGIGDALDFMETLGPADDAYAQAASVYQAMGRPRDAARVTLARAAMRYYNVWDVARAADLLTQAQRMHPAPEDDDDFMARYAIYRAVDANINGNVREERAWYEQAGPRAARTFRDNTTRTVMAVRTLSRLDGKFGTPQTGIDRLNALVARLKQDRRARPAWIVGALDDLGSIEYMAGRYRAALERYDAEDDFCRRSSDPEGIQCLYAQYQRANAMLVLGFSERALDTVPMLLASARVSEDSMFLAARFTRQAYSVLVANRQLDRHPAVSAKVQALVASMDGKPDLWLEEIPLLLAEARMRLGAGEAEKAHALSTRAVARMSGRESGPRDFPDAFVLQALAVQALGRHEAALEILDKIHAEEIAIRGADHPFTQLVSIHRARALWATGQQDKALEILDRAVPILKDAMGPDAPSYAKLKALREELVTTRPDTAGGARKVDLLI